MPKEKIETPTPQNFSDFPEWQEVNTRLCDLKTEHARLESRATEIQAILNKRADTPRLTAIARAALALITRKAAEQEEDVIKLQEELQEIRTKRPHYEAAIRMQADEVRKVEQQLSRQICEPLIEVDKRELQEGAALLVAGARKLYRQLALREQLEARGVKWTRFLHPFRLPFADLSQDFSELNMFARELTALGMTVPGWTDPVTRRQPVPGEWRTVRLLTVMAGPNGIFFPGQELKTQYSDYMIRNHMAVPSDSMMMESLRKMRSALKASPKAEVEAEAKDDVKDSVWTPAQS